MAGVPQVGDAAPPFRLPRDGGGEVSMESFAGRTLVLYFYPKDDTSGCTQEASDFTALRPAFREAGAEVLGISPNSAKSHDAFIAKHKLGVTLAADESTETCQAYGVWIEKSMYGRKYMGVERTTFLIGPDGCVAEVWPKVSVKGHAEAVLAAARALTR